MALPIKAMLKVSMSGIALDKLKGRIIFIIVLAFSLYGPIELSRHIWWQIQNSLEAGWIIIPRLQTIELIGMWTFYTIGMVLLGNMLLKGKFYDR